MLNKIKKYFHTQIVKIYDHSAYHKKQNKKHFSILIVSNDFIKISMLNRHRKVYNVLSQEIKNIIYALSIHTYTVSEWRKHPKKNIQHTLCKFI